jgi:predicted O-methyltransferase YrrM
MRHRIGLTIASMVLCAGCTRAAAQLPAITSDLDASVSAFLQQRRFGWHDMNVPAADGRALYDLVVSNRFTRALEIGTSTGHSAIWIAWGLSKTGGKLVTIDIDEGRYREALSNFRAAGVAGYIDARLADAHELVPRLEGPFDLVFIDADKDWYTNYAQAVLPRLVPGGCLTAHNVSPGHGRQMTGGFYEFITAAPEMDTTFNAGVLVSCKRASRRD